MALLWLQHSTGPAAPVTFDGAGWNSDPTRLVVVVDHADGTQTRWSEQETAPDAIPADLSFGTSMPGGFQDLATQLLERFTTESGIRLALYDNVRVLGPGGQVAWEGRIQKAPRSSTPNRADTVSPQAVGWSAHLTDDKTFREIYRDPSFERWGGPPDEWRIQDQANFRVIDAVVRGWAEGRPVISLETPAYLWGIPTTCPSIQAWYDGDGIPLASITYRWTSNVTTGGDNNWNAGVSSGDFPDTLAYALTFRLGHSALANNQITANVAGDSTIAVYIYYTYAGPSGADNGTVWYGRMTSPVVVGDHGLSASTGVTASDVVMNVLGRAAPKLRYTTGTGGSIETTSFPIPYLVFPEPSTAADVIGRANAPHNYDWAVWENKMFHYHQPAAGPSRTWRASAAEGLTLNGEGDTTDRIYNGVIVKFTDFAGRDRAVGPFSSSAVFKNGSLEDSDPDNPATRAGIKAWGVLALSDPSTATAAAAIGQVWLTQQARASRAGVASITGTITDTASTQHPTWMVRAGDMLQVTDRPGDPLRRIISTQYSHADRRIEMTLDSTQDDLAALLERVGGSLVGVT